MITRMPKILDMLHTVCRPSVHAKFSEQRPRGIIGASRQYLLPVGVSVHIQYTVHVIIVTLNHDGQQRRCRSVATWDFKVDVAVH